jgi:hypothetical protein
MGFCRSYLMLGLLLPTRTAAFSFVGFHKRLALVRRHLSSTAATADDGISNSHTYSKTADAADGFAAPTTHANSNFALHALVNETAIDARDFIQSALDTSCVDRDNNLSADELLHMGSVWYLPASEPRDPSLGVKPIRLARSQMLGHGDYLRIHHSPRRFLQVYDYDWNKFITDNCDDENDAKKGVIVARGADWIVIDKPQRVPVHMTVDNRIENVQYQMSSRLDDGYVGTPQRLDQNTSGLMVVATSPVFARYFATLLKNKTEHQIKGTNTYIRHPGDGGVRKEYKWYVLCT